MNASLICFSTKDKWSFWINSLHITVTCCINLIFDKQRGTRWKSRSHCVLTPAVLLTCCSLTKVTLLIGLMHVCVCAGQRPRVSPQCGAAWGSTCAEDVGRLMWSVITQPSALLQQCTLTITSDCVNEITVRWILGHRQRERRVPVAVKKSQCVSNWTDPVK